MPTEKCPSEMLSDTFLPAAKTASERVATLRSARAAQGLKRREVYAHPDDWPAIRALAEWLAIKRVAPRST